MTGPVFDTIAIIGAGLIGSSTARAANAVQASENVVLFDRSEKVRTECRSLDIGHVVDSAKDAVSSADCTILGVPMGAMESVMSEISDALKTGSIVTDVGSTKADGHRSAQNSLSGWGSPYTGSPDRRNRTIRPCCRLCKPLRKCVAHSNPAR